MTPDIISRNFHALNENVKTLAAKVEDQRLLCNQLQSQVNEKTTQISQLQQQVALLRVKAMGTGPTG